MYSIVAGITEKHRDKPEDSGLSWQKSAAESTAALFFFGMQIFVEVLTHVLGAMMALVRISKWNILAWRQSGNRGCILMR